MKRQIVSRAFYGCECRARWGHGRQGRGRHCGHGLLARPHPQGWPTAATCPLCGPTCRRWCITTSSRPPGLQGPRGASARKGGASIRRMKRCAREVGPGRGGAGAESRAPCSPSSFLRPPGHQVNHSSGRDRQAGTDGLGVALVTVESQLGLWVPREGHWTGRTFCFHITPLPFLPWKERVEVGPIQL